VPSQTPEDSHDREGTDGLTRCLGKQAAPKFEPKEGDWKCDFCGNINFRWRHACNKCECPRPKLPRCEDRAALCVGKKDSDDAKRYKAFINAYVAFYKDGQDFKAVLTEANKTWRKRKKETAYIDSVLAGQPLSV